jgi:NAD(P)-dependent dehydrogenase (short-subunit alcohol dehydrogenase family)
VAGATRGAGRGIARALGEAGATVYCKPTTTSSRENVANEIAALTGAQFPAGETGRQIFTDLSTARGCVKLTRRALSAVCGATLPLWLIDIVFRWRAPGPEERRA